LCDPYMLTAVGIWVRFWWTRSAVARRYSFV
jgi:hypothetical protein